MAITGPAPWSTELKVVITCGADCDPGQNGQKPGCVCRSTSSPTITQERVIGSLRSSMLSLGKQRGAGMVNRKPAWRIIQHCLYIASAARLGFLHDANLFRPPYLISPPGLFLSRIETKGSKPNRPLRDAWVTQEPPLGHPVPSPIPTPIGRGSQIHVGLCLCSHLRDSVT